MATITIQEILGSDNIALSRPVINSNFIIIRDGVNILESFLNTSPVGGELSIGKATISIGSNAVTDVNLISETSARIEGNLQVLKNLTVEEICNFNSNVIITDNTTFLRNDSTINYLSINARTTFNDVINIDANDALVTMDEIALGPIDVTDYGTASKQGKNVLNIDLLGTGSTPNTAITLGDGDDGQVLLIKFPVAPTASDTYTFDMTNFDTIYGSGVQITGDVTLMKKASLLLTFTSNGWFVLNIYAPGASVII